MTTVVMYSIRDCPHCAKAKAFFMKNGIQFTEYDVDKDEIRWREAMALADGKDIVPVIDIGGKILYGAYSTKMEQELKKELGIKQH